MKSLKSRLRDLTLVIFLVILLSGCFRNVKVFPDAQDPLKETVLEGKGDDKVLLIPISGVISNQPGKKLFGSTKPSMVAEFVAKLRKAEKDESVKAVLISVNSPGGTVTASDIIYNEIVKFKNRSKKKVVVLMMDVAASGGYYVSIPADYIIAHPTTVTGSIGVITMKQDMKDLMSKIGVGVTVYKSGRNKDMGSPFRISSDEEKNLMQAIVKDLAKRFVSLVKKRRGIKGENLSLVKTARVFLPDEAKKIGLIDKIGYFEDAVKKAKNISKIADNSRLVVYKRAVYFDDNVYNNQGANLNLNGKSLLGLDFIPDYKTGFYYMWLP